jgi:hypothetical protein
MLGGMGDRYAALRADVRKAILESDGVLARDVRRQAFAGQGAPGAIATYVATVQANAYKVHDEMVNDARKAGLDDDGLFEITAAAAIGKATAQLDAALAALDAALAEPVATDAAGSRAAGEG